MRNVSLFSHRPSRLIVWPLMLLLILQPVFGQTIQDGITAYDNADFRGAIRTLESALQREQDRVRRMRGYEYLFASHMALEQSSQAHDAAIKYLYLSPGTSLNSVDFSPSLVGEFNRIRSANVRKATLKSMPSGASLWVDGNYIGATPATTDLVDGIHSARLTHGGYQEKKSEFSTYYGASSLEFKLNPIQQETASNYSSSRSSGSTYSGASNNNTDEVAATIVGIIIVVGLLVLIANAPAEEEEGEETASNIGFSVPLHVR